MGGILTIKWKDIFFSFQCQYILLYFKSQSYLIEIISGDLGVLILSFH